MLYIKFDLTDPQKFEDFEILYAHLCHTRTPDFEPLEEREQNLDWDTMSDEEMQVAIAQMFDAGDPEVQAKKRYEQFIPTYADTFLEDFVAYDEVKAGRYGFHKMGIFNYLEVGFEVDFDALELLGPTLGIIKFHTGNYPFGGLERFLICMRAFGLTPTECYDGFSVQQIIWSAPFEYFTKE